MASNINNNSNNSGGAAYHGPCPTTTFQGQNSYQPGQSPVIAFPGHGAQLFSGGGSGAPSAFPGGPGAPSAYPGGPGAPSAYPGGPGAPSGYPGGAYPPPSAVYSTFHPHSGIAVDPAGPHNMTGAPPFGSPFRGQLGGGPYMEGRGGLKGGLQQYSEDQGIDMTLVRNTICIM